MFSKLYVSASTEVRGQPEGESKGDENPDADDQASLYQFELFLTNYLKV
jgi:hypothetical protein